MGIQGNINNALTSVAVVSNLAAINNSIKKLGFSNYDELISSINDLKISIADCKDKQIACKNKEELLEEYLKIKNEYDEALKEKEKKANKILIGFWIVFGIALIITMIVVCSSIYD